jgi:hypothetical protein
MNILTITKVVSLALCASMFGTSCQNWSTLGQGRTIRDGSEKLINTVKIGDNIDAAEINLRSVGLGTGRGVYPSPTSAGMQYMLQVDYGAEYWSAAKTAMQIWEDLPPGRSAYGFVYADHNKIVFRVRTD